MDRVLDQNVTGIKGAKVDVPQPQVLGAAPAAAGLEMVVLPAPCPGTPSMLGMAPSRDLGFSRGTATLLVSLVGGCCSPRCRRSGTRTPGATLLASHSDQCQACHIQIHVFLHLSCSKDLKCIEGSWERASLTKGKKDKYTEETALPMQQALRLLRWKTSMLSSWQSPGLQSRSCMAWGSLRLTATSKTQRYVGCREMTSLPPHPPQRNLPWGCGTNCKAVGQGSTTPEQRLGHWNRESKCL